MKSVAVLLCLAGLVIPSPAAAEGAPDGAGNYRSIGQVYQDTITGKMFVVEETK